MTTSINFRLLLWATAVVQPADPLEILNYLRAVLKDSETLPDIESIKTHLKLLKKLGYVDTVSAKYDLYSITLDGDEKLTSTLRKLRDKVRIFLLDKCMKEAKFRGLASTDTTNMGGVSPSLQFRSFIKEVPHPGLPWAFGTLPNRPRQAWVRISEQLNIGLKFSSEASTPSNKENEKLSNIPAPIFYSQKSLNHASFKDSGVLTIAACLGITPRLISSMIKSPENYYRHFVIKKKSGGERDIFAPRKFIKVTQYWIKDYLLNRLKINAACYSYRKGASIKDNAEQHQNNKFLANMDIDSFFESINKTMIKNCLFKHEFSEHIIDTVSGLVTMYGSLPQGAPTSPVISNAILYEFDTIMVNNAIARDCVYTRYSDDISISGNNRESVIELIRISESKLLNLGFRLNNKKSRLLSYNNKQVVTGILINGPLRPTRTYRKKVRAMFHQAWKNKSKDRVNELNGHFNYLKSFEKYGFKFNENEYKKIINELSKIP
jgi:hypothetical protein